MDIIGLSGAGKRRLILTLILVELSDDGRMLSSIQVRAHLPYLL